MCLLITQPAGVAFSDEFLQGVYARNADGLGVMYVENGALQVKKCLPKTYEDMKAFYDEHIRDRACAAHWRMKTHGHIDLSNCHPYEVLNEAEHGYTLWMMHNGVLHTGNHRDVTMSDTWHYINDYLRPILKNNPELFMNEAFLALVGDQIGSNRFAFMDGHGNLSVVNKNQGVSYNGAWLSNTYAWDTKGTVHEPKTYRGAYGGYYGLGSNLLGTGYGAYDDYDDDLFAGTTKAIGNAAPVTAPAAAYDLDDDEALYDDVSFWFDALEAAVESMPMTEKQAERLSDYSFETYYLTVGPVEAWSLIDHIWDGRINYWALLCMIMNGEGISTYLEETTVCVPET